MGIKILSSRIALDTRKKLDEMKFKTGENISEMVTPYIMELSEDTKIISGNSAGQKHLKMGVTCLPPTVKHVRDMMALHESSQCRVLATAINRCVAAFDFDQVYEKLPIVRNTTMALTEEQMATVNKFCKDNDRTRNSFASIAFKAMKNEEFQINFHSKRGYRQFDTGDKQLGVHFRDQPAEELRDMAEDLMLPVTRLIRHITKKYISILQDREREDEVNEEW